MSYQQPNPQQGYYYPPQAHQQQGYYPPVQQPYAQQSSYGGAPQQGGYPPTQAFPPPPPQQQYPPPQYYGQSSSLGGSGGNASADQKPFDGKSSGDQLYSAPPPPANGSQGDGSGRFNFLNSPRFPDLWATLLFLANLVAFGILSALGFVAFTNRKPSSSTPSNTTPSLAFPKGAETQLFTILGITIAGSFVISIGYFLLMRTFGRFMIKLSMTVSILGYFAYAFALLYFKQYFFGILMVILAIINAVWFYAVRRRIPLAAITMETVCGVVARFPSLLIITVLSLAIQVAFSGWWSYSTMGLQVKYKDDSTTMYIVLVYVLFSLYWVAQVLKNTLHVTVAGVFGSFFFLEGTAR